MRRLLIRTVLAVAVILAMAAAVVFWSSQSRLSKLYDVVPEQLFADAAVVRSTAVDTWQRSAAVSSVMARTWPDACFSMIR